MYYEIGCNIFDISNQLLFIFQELALELKIFVLLSTQLTKVFDYIQAFKEKYKV